MDATTRQAHAALKAIVRRDNGILYDECVAPLRANEAVEEPTPAQRQRWDRPRKNSLPNSEWVNPQEIRKR